MVTKPKRLAIPHFPEFKPLDIADKKRIEKIVKLYQPYSDHNFTSLLSWNVNNNTSYSFLNGNLLMRLDDYLTYTPTYTLIGTNKISHTIDTLMRYIEKSGHTPQIKLVPEIVVQSSKSLDRKYIITEDRDNFDYVYDIPELTTLQGGQYAVKRNFVNRFLKKYKTKHKIITITNPKIQKQIRMACKKWQDSREKDANDVATEFAALDVLLKNAKELKLLTIGIYDKDELIGFSINEVLNFGYAINLFEKGDVKYQGIFQYLRQLTALYLVKYGCQFLNHEQDLGIEGLRKSKLSYHPKFYLKKYTITKRSNGLTNMSPTA